MTELKLNARPESTSRTPRTSRRTYVTSVFAALLMVIIFLGIIGASKSSSKSAIVDPSNQNSPAEKTTEDSSIGPVNPTPGPLPAPAAKKKTKRQRPATVTYVDGTHGVSFRYPRKFALNAGEQAASSGVPLNFVEPGGVSVATVELPGALYKGTDFVDGFFHVSVHKNLTGAQCEQFASQGSSAVGDVASSEVEPAGVTLPSEQGVGRPLQASFRGMAFSQLEMATDLSLTRYYHRYENNTCYEFVLGLETAPHESVDDMPPVDDRDVFARLEKILATVKLRPLAGVSEAKAEREPAAEILSVAKDHYSNNQ